MPHVVILGGPNGAGKTTAAPALLRDALAVAELVNADAIAAGLSAFHPERASFAAGRIMLARLRELAASGADFAFETTLASRTFAPWLETLRPSGYRISLLYLRLSSPELAVSRVAERVRLGGHLVPEDIIRRRYARGLSNFFAVYRPIADRWQVFDNSAASAPRPVASGRGPCDDVISDPVAWKEMQDGAEWRA